MPLTFRHQTAHVAGTLEGDQLVGKFQVNGTKQITAFFSQADALIRDQTDSKNYRIWCVL